MADDAILFKPTPVNGKEFFRARPANPGPILAWYPSYAELSGSNDLGWTTGPWEYREAKGKEPAAWGHFATVWQRQLDGSFKVLIDEGTPARSRRRTPDVGAPARHPQAGRDVSLPEFVGAQTSLLAADAAYSKLLVEQGMGAALAKYADDDVRLLREDRPELRGIAAAGKALEHEWDAGVAAWDTKAGAISKATDLAFTYGMAQLGEKAKEPDGRKVFRVWRKKPGADWKLALDVTNAVPPPAPAAKKP
jgi:ketosteroid isomerase-like protein